MKARTILCSLVLLVCVGSARAQDPAAASPTSPTSPAAACRAYTSAAPSAPAPLAADQPAASTIVVPDVDFRPAAVAVAGLDITHSRIGGLKITLTASPLPSSPAVAPTTAVLKDVRAGGTGQNLNGTAFADSAASPFPTDPAAAPFAAAYTPAQPLATAFAPLPSAGGNWTLRAADLGSGRESRTITLAGWTLVLCPEGVPLDQAALAAALAPVTAADGAATPAAASNATAATPAADAATATPAAAVDATAAPTNATAAATNATAANGTAKASTSSPGALEELLNRLNRAGPDAALEVRPRTPRSAATAAADASAATPAADLSDAGLVDRLLGRLTEVNATRSTRMQQLAEGAAAATPAGAAGGADRLVIGRERDGLLGLRSTPANATAAAIGTAAAAAAPAAGANASAADAAIPAASSGSVAVFDAATPAAAAAATPLFRNANGNASAPLLGGANASSVWFLGDLVLNDQDGLVPDFLSALSEVLYLAANATEERDAQRAAAAATLVNGTALSGAAELVAAQADQLSNVTSMAQSAFRSLVDTPSLMDKLFPFTKVFKFDPKSKLLDALTPGRDRTVLTTSLKAGAAAAGTTAAVASDAGEALREWLGEHFRTSKDFAGVAGGYLRGSMGNAKEFKDGREELYEGLVEGMVTNRVEAMQTSADLMSGLISGYAAKVVGAMDMMEGLVRGAAGKLSGLRLRDGSPADGPLSDLLSGSREALGALGAGMMEDARDTMDLLAGAYKGKLSAAGEVASSAAGAFRDVAGAQAGISLGAMEAAMDRVSTKLVEMRVVSAWMDGAGPVTSRTADAYKGGLELMQGALGKIRDAVAPASAGSWELGSLVGKMDLLGGRIEDLLAA